MIGFSGLPVMIRKETQGGMRGELFRSKDGKGLIICGEAKGEGQQTTRQKPQSPS